MSKMIQCDECKKMMYTDSREDKGAFVSMTADDPLYGYSSFHLCRKCFNKKFPWLIDTNATTNADRTDDLFKFAKWVAESVCVSDDKWEGDCWAFQEIACRMLVKLGIMEENDGVYSLKQEDEI